LFQEITDNNPTASFREHFIWTLLTDFTFIVFALCNLLSHISFIVPVTYLPDFGQLEVGLDAAQTAMLILIIGISSALIRVVMGFIADLRCVDSMTLLSVNLVVCGLVSTFAASYNSFILLAAYATVSGIVVGKYTDVTRTSIFLFFTFSAQDGYIHTAPLHSVIEVTSVTQATITRAVLSQGPPRDAPNI